MHWVGETKKENQIGGVRIFAMVAQIKVFCVKRREKKNTYVWDGVGAGRQNGGPSLKP